VATRHGLTALLSRLLVAFTIEFDGVAAVGPVDPSVQLSHFLLALTLDDESRSKLSLPLIADVLAILNARAEDGTHRLAEGLRPPPASWRTRPPYLTQSKAFVADPWRLPAQPMVLHRGGYPDGS
jgi:hypothetical protein